MDAGGLAAQYKFGARTGTALLFLGLCKIVLSLVFGSSIVQLIEVFPSTVLGVMLVASAIELAGACRKQSSERGVFEMLLVAACTLWGSTFVGFAAGMMVHGVLLAADAGRRRWKGRAHWKVLRWARGVTMSGFENDEGDAAFENRSNIYDVQTEDGGSLSATWESHGDDDENGGDDDRTDCLEL